ncbi:MAG: DNA alkylation repair protein [Gallicola sp.]|nr:DNA alkylation repair protein [Gallicola sp.]
MKNIRKDLFTMEDLEYKEFHRKLIPTVDPNTIIGIRTPRLRNYAKELMKRDEKTAFLFLEDLPHSYYEENNLHGFLIETMKDLDKALAYTESFLPYIDNWATCDSFTPKVFKKHPRTVFKEAEKWIQSRHTYTVRYGIGILLSNYLDKEFHPEILDLVAGISSDEYYIKMMIAWFFSTAIIKQRNAALPYLENQTLDTWTHNKTIQKCIDSFRISNEDKAYLRTLRIK